MAGSLTRESIVFVGDFPPPITGAAKNNLKVADLLDQHFKVRRLNTSGGEVALRRTVRYHVKRVVCNLFAMGAIVSAGLRERIRFYHVPNAGMGKLYTFVFVFAAAFFASKIVLHHRGFSYIDRRSFFMFLVTRMASRKAIHVFLSERMRTLFDQQYRFSGESIVISNVSLLDFPIGKPKKVADCVRYIGHLSNLCPEKGFNHVVDLFESIAVSDSSVRLVLAGPFVDSSCEARYEKLKVKFANRVEYLGLIRGEDKVHFYDKVDFFVFPTCYAVEAEPNVIWESLARGCVTAAYARGCVAEILSPGLVVEPCDSFVERVSPWMLHLLRNNDDFENASQDAIEFVLQSARKSNGALAGLIGRMG